MNHLDNVLCSFICIMLLVSSCKKTELFPTNSNEHQNEQVAGKIQLQQPNSTTTTNPNGPILFNTGIFNPGTVCGTPEISTLYAGQNIEAGTVTLSNSATHLIVTINTTGDWVIGHTHVYVGALSGMPTTGNGNPQIGHFPSNTSHNPMVTSFTYYYDLSTLDPCFIVAVHAEVHLLDGNGDIVQSETAWANNTQNNTSGSWAGYISYCQQNCNPCVYNTISYDIFGGQTLLVGSLDVTNDATNLYVTYSTTGGWELGETHLYVGAEAGLPTNNSNTPIPGQFPYSQTHTAGTTSVTYTIPLSSIGSTCYIIAAHASVGRIDEEGDWQSETSWSFGTEFPNTNRWGWFSNYCTQICGTVTSGSSSGMN